MSCGMTLPRVETVEPLEAKKAKFVDLALSFGCSLLATIYMRPPGGRTAPTDKVNKRQRDWMLIDATYLSRYLAQLSHCENELFRFRQMFPIFGFGAVALSCPRLSCPFSPIDFLY